VSYTCDVPALVSAQDYLVEWGSGDALTIAEGEKFSCCLRCRRFALEDKRLCIQRPVDEGVSLMSRLCGFGFFGVYAAAPYGSTRLLCTFVDPSRIYNEHSSSSSNSLTFLCGSAILDLPASALTHDVHLFAG